MYVRNKSEIRKPMECQRQPSNFSIDNLLCESHQGPEQSSTPEQGLEPAAHWTFSDSSKSSQNIQFDQLEDSIFKLTLC